MRGGKRAYGRAWILCGGRGQGHGAHYGVVVVLATWREGGPANPAVTAVATMGCSSSVEVPDRTGDESRSRAR
jgi:hypothetical protein